MCDDPRGGLVAVRSRRDPSARIRGWSAYRPICLRPVTPEVEGSSPVAPGLRSAWCRCTGVPSTGRWGCGTLWDEPRVGEIGGDLLEGWGEPARGRLVVEGLRAAGDARHRL